MDLLFKRYASPFILLDQAISLCNFSDLVDQIFSEMNEEKKWEFYLHKLHPEDNRTYDDFKRDIEDGKGRVQPPAKKEKMSNKDIETTIQESIKMTMNFVPCDIKEVKR